ncbi:MAG: hypothetical protein Ct9H300mP2_2280 [Candidatus Neomarinimicrobiota bacterium]|nr:MAG: hypothetical protein Ct9H300mP2_2280 [Candidatus Neomarinimicrobiota bacterium]
MKFTQPFTNYCIKSAKDGFSWGIIQVSGTVEDLNENANLKYTMVKGPHGMQMDKNGKF